MAESRDARSPSRRRSSRPVQGRPRSFDRSKDLAWVMETLDGKLVSPHTRIHTVFFEKKEGNAKSVVSPPPLLDRSFLLFVLCLLCHLLPVNDRSREFEGL